MMKKVFRVALVTLSCLLLASCTAIARMITYTKGPESVKGFFAPVADLYSSSNLNEFIEKISEETKDEKGFAWYHGESFGDWNNASGHSLKFYLSKNPNDSTISGYYAYGTYIKDDSEVTENELSEKPTVLQIEQYLEFVYKGGNFFNEEGEEVEAFQLAPDYFFNYIPFKKMFAQDSPTIEEFHHYSPQFAELHYGIDRYVKNKEQFQIKGYTLEISAGYDRFIKDMDRDGVSLQVSSDHYDEMNGQNEYSAFERIAFFDSKETYDHFQSENALIDGQDNIRFKKTEEEIVEEKRRKEMDEYTWRTLK